MRAQPREPGLVPRGAARLGHQRLERGDGRVLQHRPRARVRRARQRELRRVAEPALHVADRRRARRARSACACRRASPRAGPPASRARARRPRRPRRRAPDSRAPPGRCRAARRPSAASRSSTRAGRGARAARRRAASSSRSRGRACSRSASRSSPSATSAPRSSSTRKRIRRCGGSRATSNALARDAHAAQPLELARERVEQRLAARLEPLEHRRRHLRHRHERPAQLLRQRADQRGDELRPQRRHEPVEPDRLELRQQLERHVHGHAVALGAGVEDVAQRQRQLALAPRLGQRAPVERVAGVGDEVRAREVEQRRPRRRSSFHQRSKCAPETTSAGIRAS